MGALTSFDLCQLAEKLAARDVSSLELTCAYLERIAELDPSYGAFLLVDGDGARRAAETIDRRLAAGDDLGLLAGVPIALKDILVTTGLPTTCGSKMLSGWTPPYDAAVCERLRQAGAVIIGKTNMDEFAMGSSNENSAYFPCRNPWDLRRVPGGSSGGSAAAVAGRLCAAALGTDTGGSIRQPAAFCGVVGLKPTYGRVSRYGLVAFASSLDQIGPMTQTVRDSALMLEVIAGHDPRDSTSLDQPVGDYRAACERDVAGLRVGVPRDLFGEGLDPQVEEAVEAALSMLEEQGAERVDIELPHSEFAVAAYYLLCTAEASSNLARFDGVRYGVRQESADLQAMYRSTRQAGFGAEVKRRIMLGTFALSSGYYDQYYGKAQRARTLIRRDFDSAFESCDVIAMPTTPAPAFLLGEKVDDPLQMYLADIYTIACNLAGLPGISLPCGFSAEGLPIGFQLLGPALKEETLFSAAAAYQRATAWHLKAPPSPVAPQETSR